MAWPTSATKVNLDSGSDSPSLARAELSDLVDKFNILVANAAPCDQPVFTGRVAINNEINYGYKASTVSGGQLDVSSSSLVVVSAGATVNYFTNFTTRQHFIVLNVTGATMTVAATAGHWSQFTIAANSAAHFIEYGGGLYRIQ